MNYGLIDLFKGISTSDGLIDAQTILFIFLFVYNDLFVQNYMVLNIPFLTQFLPSSCRIDTAVWMHYMDANKTAGEEARRQLHENAASNFEQVLAATPHKTPTIRPPAPYHENYPS